MRKVKGRSTAKLDLAATELDLEVAELNPVAVELDLVSQVMAPACCAVLLPVTTGGSRAGGQ